MRLILRDDLIFAEVTVTYQEHSVDVPDVVVDTGSATTILSMDYGFTVHGILGMDFLLLAQAVIDLGALTLAFP